MFVNYFIVYRTATKVIIYFLYWLYPYNYSQLLVKFEMIKCYEYAKLKTNNVTCVEIIKVMMCERNKIHFIINEYRYILHKLPDNK